MHIDKEIFNTLQRNQVNMKTIQQPAFFQGEEAVNVENIVCMSIDDAVEKLRGKFLVVYSIMQVPIEKVEGLAVLIRGKVLDNFDNLLSWQEYQNREGMLANIDKTKGIPANSSQN